MKFTNQELTTQIAEARDIKRLVDNMEKPKNFTLIDIVHLHDILDKFIVLAEEKLNESR